MEIPLALMLTMRHKLIHHLFWLLFHYKLAISFHVNKLFPFKFSYIVYTHLVWDRDKPCMTCQTLYIFVLGIFASICASLICNFPSMVLVFLFSHVILCLAFNDDPFNKDASLNMIPTLKGFLFSRSESGAIKNKSHYWNKMKY